MSTPNLHNSTSVPASGLTELMLTPGAVDLAMLRQIQAGGVHLSLDPSVRDGMARSQAAVQHIQLTFDFHRIPIDRVFQFFRRIGKEMTKTSP